MARHDPVHYFRIESREIVDGLERGLLVEPGTQDLPELFRLAHTLKGAARVVGAERVADGAHTLEDVLAHYREQGEAIPEQGVRELLCLVDTLRDLLGSEAAPTAAAEERTVEGTTEPRQEVLRIEASEMDELAANVLDAGAHTRSLRRQLEGLTELRRMALALAHQVKSLAGSTPRVRASADEVVARLGVEQGRLAGLSDQIELDLRQINERTSTLRLLETSSLFGELERAAHDASVATGKRVSFSISGGNARVDVHVLRCLRACLGHLVRNAVFHGIESEEERVARGKSPSGSVHASIRREGRRIRVTVSDDGRGIDRTAVRDAAERLGLTKQGADEAAEDWIFEPGLSTAHEVTVMAGRGVGLDAVREAVERCHGTVRVRTTTGEGTQFELDLPISHSAITALGVQVDGATFLLPLDAVSATQRIREDDVLDTGSGAHLMYLGEALPLRRLQAATDPGASSLAELGAVVIVESRGKRVALGVTRVSETREVIVRGIPAFGGNSPLVIGAALDAGGKPELVLSTDALVDTHGHAERARTARHRRKPVLVIDDSLTTRMLEHSILDAAGYEVELACSAEEGLQKARALDFGLIVVDLEMPGMNGHEFAREVRADLRLATTPIIMVTSVASEESRAKARAAGVSAYIVKGEFDQGRFLATVAGHLP